MLDKVTVEILRRIANLKADRLRRSSRLDAVMKELGIGTLAGASVLVTAADKQRAAAVLVGQGFSASVPSAATRASATQFGPREKSSAIRVKDGRVSVKALPSGTLCVGGKLLPLPEQCHLNADFNALLQEGLQHSAVLFIDNFEPFNRLHEYDLRLAPHCVNPLVIYRGDQGEGQLNHVLAFLQAASLPVYAFVDLDPQALGEASQLPRLAGVVAPSLTDLHLMLTNMENKRTDLFDTQAHQWARLLDALPPSSPCYDLWSVIKRNQAGITVERFGREPTACVIHGV